MRVLLLTGGWSSEREVSLKGAEQIAVALRSLQHQVTVADLSNEFVNLPALAANHDVAFINLHGTPGEDGLVQAMLDKLGLPYQGSDPAGSFLALNKAASKILLRHAKLPTPDWHFLPTMPSDDWSPKLSFPLFVKSNTGGSSLHLFRVENKEELHNALESIFAQGQEVLIEPLVEGQEVTCGVLGDGANLKALPPVLIVPKTSFFDYQQKYTANGAEEICPAPLPEAIVQNIQQMAIAAHETLGLFGYSRTDFIVRQDGALFILETNTLPGMTNASLIPKEAAAIGIAYPDFVEMLLHMAMEKHAQKHGTSPSSSTLSA